MWVGIFHDDDSASGLNFIEIEEVFIFLCDFDIFAEESDIVFVEMFVFIIEFLFDKYFLKLACTYPWEELEFEFSVLEDVILKD